jgi:hypothetical protein
LLRRLRGDATECLAGLLDAQDVTVFLVLISRLACIDGMPKNLEAELLAHLGRETELLGVFEGDLAIFVRDVIDDRHVLK